MLARFMAIPHHTYLLMKMPTPNGILSIYGNIMVSYRCDAESIDLASTSAYATAASAMVTQASTVDVSTLEVPEQKCTETALDPGLAIKRVCLNLSDKTREVSIGVDLTEK